MFYEDATQIVLNGKSDGQVTCEFGFPRAEGDQTAASIRWFCVSKLRLFVTLSIERGPLCYKSQFSSASILKSIFKGVLT
jgi:hypothetical protein